MKPEPETRLDELAHLSVGWYDGDRSVPPPSEALASARICIQSMEPGMYIYPTLDGGLSLEWDNGGASWEITPGGRFVMHPAE